MLLVPECERVQMCLCGNMNLADTRDETTHSPIPLSPGDCTSGFSLGGVFLSSVLHLLSTGRISDEHTTGFRLFFRMV